MSLIDTTIIDPNEATGAVQGAFDAVSAQLPFNQVLPNALLTALPEGLTADNMTVSWVPNQRIDVDSEPLFRAWDAESPYGATKGNHTVKKVDVQPLGKRMRITESDIARAGDSAYTHDTAVDYFSKLGAEVAFKLEKAKLATTLNAKLNVTEHGLNRLFDYGRASALTVALDDKSKWSADGVDPVSDILQWIDLVTANDGMVPRAIVLSRKVLSALKKSPAILGYVYSAGTGATPASAREEDVVSVLSEYADIQNVLVADRAYDTYFQTNGIKQQSMFPDDTVLLLPGLGDTGLGATGIGPTAEAANGTVSNPGNMGLVGVVEETPSATPAFDIYVTGTALPILAQPNSTLAATVL